MKSSPVFDHFDAEAGAYTNRSAGWLWGPLRRREARAVMNALDPQPGERILDAGCGAGHFAMMIRDRGAEVVGVDGSLKMVAAAEANGIEAAEHDLEASPPPGGPFDKILCAGALEFCSEPALVIRNLWESVREGGSLVLFAPRLCAMGRLYRRHHRRHGIDIHLFTEEEFASALPSVAPDSVQRVAFALTVRFKREGIATE